MGLGLGYGPDRWAEGFFAAMAALLAFELAVLATGVGWTLRRSRALGALLGVEAAVDALLTVAAAALTLTFEVKVELRPARSEAFRRRCA